MRRPPRSSVVFDLDDPTQRRKFERLNIPRSFPSAKLYRVADSALTLPKQLRQPRMLMEIRRASSFVSILA
jgi:hypothetical protein